MATTISVYLDTRAVPDECPAPLKISVRRNGQAAFIPLDIRLLPSQWDNRKMAAKDHPNARQITMLVTKKRYEYESALLKLMESNQTAGLNAVQIREKILDIVDPERKQRLAEERLFKNRLVRYRDLQANDRTQATYTYTLKHLESFDPKLHLRKFEDITKDYIQNFENHCTRSGLKKNSRNICLRCIRAVFNDAIDAEITTAYPFRKISITPEATKKKALTIEQLRTLIQYPCTGNQEQYRDIFLLMFMFRGVNAGDLFLATKKDVIDGRFDYRRNKVGTLFSVKIEPEARRILNRYQGIRHLICPLDRYKNYQDYLHHFNDGLKAIGQETGKRGKITGKGLFPELSSNWARHTWATVASYIDIPKEVISKALGHSFGLAVTDIYIDFDMKKVDDANRKVLDYVFYGIDWRDKMGGHPTYEASARTERNETKSEDLIISKVKRIPCAGLDNTGTA